MKTMAGYGDSIYLQEPVAVLVEKAKYKPAAAHAKDLYWPVLRLWMIYGVLIIIPMTT